MPRGTCEFCDYSHLHGESYDRQCRHDPPVFVESEYGGRFMFPIVRDNDWCGQWKEVDKNGRQGQRR